MSRLLQTNKHSRLGRISKKRTYALLVSTSGFSSKDRIAGDLASNRITPIYWNISQREE
jgi:hypothetical protein